ncbi:hypothetical protein C0583_05615 [Candidatus Parcubacteria bacterium]|nr:MAG: hypothetical protein C0583_05615 [Candidatus Parcubacteria bacterium]
MKKFHYQDAIKFCWERMKENFWFFFGSLMTIGLVSWISEDVDKLSENNPSFDLTILSILLLMLMLILDLGMMNISLKIHDKKEVTYTDLFNLYPRILKYFLTNLLYFLIVFGGLLLFIVPGIIWAIKFQFCSYLIADKNLGPIEALKESSRLTRDAKMDLFFFGFIVFIVVLAGALCLVIGLFFAIPTVMVAYAYVFRKLQENKIEIIKEPESKK